MLCPAIFQGKHGAKVRISWELAKEKKEKVREMDCEYLFLSFLASKSLEIVGGKQKMYSRLRNTNGHGVFYVQT